MHHHCVPVQALLRKYNFVGFMVLWSIKSFLCRPLQYLILAALVSCKDRKLIVRKIIIRYNSLYDSVPFLAGNNIYHYEIFQKISNFNQIYWLELSFLIFCHIVHPLILL